MDKVTKTVNVPTEEEVNAWATRMFEGMQQDGCITTSTTPANYTRGLIAERLKSVLWSTGVWPK